MDKCTKKSDVEVDELVAPEPLEKGKWEAEVSSEDEVKRHKFEESTVQAESKVTTSAKNGHVESESSDKGSVLEEYTTTDKKEEIGYIAAPEKKDERSDKSEATAESETSSAVTEKAYATLITEGPVASVKKTDKSIESCDSSSQGQICLDEDIAAPNEAPTTPNAKKLVVSTQKKDESSSSEFGCDVATAEKAAKNKNESSSDVGSAGEDDVSAKNCSAVVAKKKNVPNEEPELNPKTPVTPKEQITAPKTLFVGNLSFAVEQEDVEDFFKAAGEVINISFGMNSDETFRGFGYVEFASAEAAQKALCELNGKDLLRRPVRLDIAKERRSYTPCNGKDNQFIQKGGRAQGQNITDHEFNKFDKDQIARSLIQRFGSSSEITTVSILKDQDGAVKSSNDTEPFQTGRRDQGKRIFVRGFNRFIGIDQIRSSLKEHFGCCGEITSVYIPMDQDGAIKGIAKIEFKDNDAFNQALKLDGSELGGSALSVEEARPRADAGGSGRGRGGGWDFGGGNCWRSGGMEFGGENSWRGGGRSSWRDFGGGRSGWRGSVRDFGGERSGWGGGGWDFGGRRSSWRSGGQDAKRQKLEESTVQDETKVTTSAKDGHVDSELGDKGSGFEEHTTAAKKEPAVTAEIGNVAAPIKKDDKSESSSEFITSSDAVTEKAYATLATEGLVIATENKNESSSDVGNVGEDDVTAGNSSTVVAKKKNVSNEEPELDNVTQKEQINCSKTLYVGNLSFAVEQEDVENFFKAAGEVVSIRFGMNSDETFKGFGHVEFSSAEAAEKALHELNGKELLRRPVRLDIANERRPHTPYIGSKDNLFIQKGETAQEQRINDHEFNKFDRDQNWRSVVERFGSSGESTSVSILKGQGGAVKSNDTEPFQTGKRDQGKKIFVRGFNKFDGINQIRSSLKEHFASCGEITSVFIPMDQDGAVKGISIIEFKENDAFNKALKLDGSKLGGSALSVAEARPRGDTGGSGRCTGGGWRGGGRDSGGGRSSWRGGGRDSGGGRSSWRGGWLDFGGGRYSGGKREAEDAIEDDVLNAKRQKLEGNTVHNETKDTISAKNGHLDSKLGDKGSSLEEYSTAARKIDETSDTSESPSEFGASSEPFQMGRRDQGQRIFVRGFNKFDNEVQIRSSLEEHFGSCGEITKISVPMDQDGAIRGIAAALIEFKDSDALKQALKLDGSECGGSALSVEAAVRPRGGGGNNWSSGGRGFCGRGSWRSGGRDFCGRGSWRSGGRDFGGRSSWRSGGRDFGGRSNWRSGGRDLLSWRRGGWSGGGR